MFEKPIFCVFCPKRFKVNDKEKAGSHFWSHFNATLAPLSSFNPTGQLLGTSNDLIPDQHIELATQRQRIIDWIVDFVQFCSTALLSTTRDNWLNCPVCESLGPSSAKVYRKKSVLIDHVKSHLCYKQFICKICS